ncbi:MAG: deoxyribodipyrimidine photo-lyase [Proteobacteria bacterium]|nr:deoxyribodipyrimidine photo-lyase [Pseudomonadota bacterium]
MTAGTDHATTRGGRALVWFRRDLRDYDHAALAAALARHADVHGVFVFDRDILDALPRDDRRVTLIHAAVVELADAFARRGGQLAVVHGHARDALPAVAAALGADVVYWNRDYEPAALARDADVGAALAARGIAARSGKDQVIFDTDEVLTGTGGPYAVFTPYYRRWLDALDDAVVAPRNAGGALAGLPARLATGVPSLAALGFDAAPVAGVAGGMRAGARRLADFLTRIDGYAAARDVPALDATSRLSVDLRFGTVAVRELAREARRRARARSEGASTWLRELAWRDFFAQVLWHHPHVVDAPFDRAWRRLRFPAHDDRFAAWCEGRTGFPLVDAAMRELATTGFMHNRVRMVVASFLVKDLLVDWRRGERWFAAQLLDYDLASNNGNWQWAASTGCDAQPWFRIFNPWAQSKRFDPDGTYIRRHVPELADVPAAALHAPGLIDVPGYPAPIVDHAAARTAALALYERARAS